MFDKNLGLLLVAGGAALAGMAFFGRKEGKDKEKTGVQVQTAEQTATPTQKTSDGGSGGLRASEPRALQPHINYI